jgi:hypothetical protein
MLVSVFKKSPQQSHKSGIFMQFSIFSPKNKLSSAFSVKFLAIRHFVSAELALMFNFNFTTAKNF